MTRSASAPTGQLPDDIADIQARFTQLLRTPLSTRDRRFAVDPATFDAQLVADIEDDERADARQRLSVYQRQYWLRLFTALQEQFPLSARVLGMFHFNRVAQLYLSKRGPAHHDLARVGDELPSFVESTPAVFALMAEHKVNVPKPALLQSLAIDQAWHRAWFAPAAPRFQPSQDDAATLAQMRLHMNATATLITEEWPLVALRQTLQAQLTHDHVALPKRLPQARHWLVMRTDKRITSLRLQPKQALLYRVCSEQSLDAALSRLQHVASTQERAGLPALVQQWLAQSMSLGLWIGAQRP